MSTREFKIYGPLTGLVIESFDDLIRPTVLRRSIRSICGTTMFCPFSGIVLDCRTCVVVMVGDDIKSVMSPEGWAKVRKNWPKVAEKFPGAGVYSARKASLDLPKVKP